MESSPSFIISFFQSFFISLQDFWNFPFLSFALVGGILLAMMTAVISPLMLARNHTFMGTAISHSSLLGMALTGMILPPLKDHFLPAQWSTQNILDGFSFAIVLVITMALALVMALSQKNGKGKDGHNHQHNDQFLGVFYTGAMALGIILASLNTQNSSGNSLSLSQFLFGNILLLSSVDIGILAAIFLVFLVLFILPLGQWIQNTVDEGNHRLDSPLATWYTMVFYIFMALLIVASIKLCGAILIETLLIIPGFFALQFSRSLKSTFSYALIFSLCTMIFGLTVANFMNLPTGATISVVQSMLLFLFMAFKKICYK